MQTFSDNEKSRPRPARWSWLPRAALRCFWRGFGERQGVRGKHTAQNFAFSEFWPFLHLFHVIMKNFYTFLSILIFSVCFILIFEKTKKRRTFVRRFCCASFSSTQVGARGGTWIIILFYQVLTGIFKSPYLQWFQPSVSLSVNIWYYPKRSP